MKCFPLLELWLSRVNSSIIFPASGDPGNVVLSGGAKHNVPSHHQNLTFFFLYLVDFVSGIYMSVLEAEGKEIFFIRLAAGWKLDSSRSEEACVIVCIPQRGQAILIPCSLVLGKRDGRNKCYWMRSAKCQ